MPPVDGMAKIYIAIARINIAFPFNMIAFPFKKIRSYSSLFLKKPAGKRSFTGRFSVEGIPSLPAWAIFPYTGGKHG